MANTLYFAYGSNINLDQMSYRCPDASVVGPVALEGYELLFRRNGFATIAPKEGGKVHGLLWSLTPACEQSLDRYEGYPRFYDRETIFMRIDYQTTDTLDNLPEFCSPGDLSKVLPVSRATLYRMADQGRIPCIRLGRRIIISREHLKRWFDLQMGVDLNMMGVA